MTPSDFAVPIGLLILLTFLQALVPSIMKWNYASYDDGTFDVPSGACPCFIGRRNKSDADGHLALSDRTIALCAELSLWDFIRAVRLLDSKPVRHSARVVVGSGGLIDSITAIQVNSGHQLSHAIHAGVHIAETTPPVGLNVFVLAAAIEGKVSLGKIFGGILRFLVSDIVVLLLLIAFPVLSLFIPMSM